MFSYAHQQKTNNKHANFIPYTINELEAINSGYVEIYDSRAYRGRYFIKNGKKWIHNLEALRHELNKIYSRYIDDEELSSPAPEGFGYDVENYYLRNKDSNELIKMSFFQKLWKKYG